MRLLFGARLGYGYTSRAGAIVILMYTAVGSGSGERNLRLPSSPCTNRAPSALQEPCAAPAPLSSNKSTDFVMPKNTKIAKYINMYIYIYIY